MIQSLQNHFLNQSSPQALGVGFLVGRWLKILAAVSLLGIFGSVSAQTESPNTEPLEMQEKAPERYVVVKGDTLWGISGKFLKKPWRWPEIWQLNKEKIRDPHWIYPGDVVILDMVDGKPQLRLLKADNARSPLDKGGPIKLSPEIRLAPREEDAIPSIPVAEIEPFLVRPLVIEANALDKAPKIVAARDDRVAFSRGDAVYVTGIDDTAVTHWQVYRLGKPLKTLRAAPAAPGEKSKVTEEVLGYEAIHLGDARLVNRGEVSSMQITNSRDAIQVGDRLLPSTTDITLNYVPHAPEQPMVGQILRLVGGVAEGGKNNVVAIDLGAREGVEVGHVLAVYQKARAIEVPNQNKKSWSDPKTVPLSLPEERIGLAFVFRVFDKVSYALIVASNRPIAQGDTVREP